MTGTEPLEARIATSVLDPSTDEYICRIPREVFESTREGSRLQHLLRAPEETAALRVVMDLLSLPTPAVGDDGYADTGHLGDVLMVLMSRLRAIPESRRVEIMKEGKGHGRAYLWKLQALRCQ